MIIKISCLIQEINDNNFVFAKTDVYGYFTETVGMKKIEEFIHSERPQYENNQITV